MSVSVCVCQVLARATHRRFSDAKEAWITGIILTKVTPWPYVNASTRASRQRDDESRSWRRASAGCRRNYFRFPVDEPFFTGTLVVCCSSLCCRGILHDFWNPVDSFLTIGFWERKKRHVLCCFSRVVLMIGRFLSTRRERECKVFRYEVFDRRFDRNWIRNWFSSILLTDVKSIAYWKGWSLKKHVHRNFNGKSVIMVSTK